MKCHIVLCNSNLGRNLDGLLSKVVYVFDCINEWYLKFQTWLQLFAKFLEPMHQYGIILRHNHGKSKEGSIVFSNSLGNCVAFVAIVHAHKIGAMPYQWSS